MKEIWVLLYLVDWDEGRPVIPDIHGFYETEKGALDARRMKLHPERYWVRKARNYTQHGI